MARPRPRSINHYALAFFLAFALAVAALSGLALRELKIIGQQIAATERELAAQEWRQGLNTLLAKVQATGRALAEWDETAPIFDTPAYYRYWRHVRLPSANPLRESVVAFDLYTIQGRSLADLGTAPNGAAPALPPRIDPYRTQPYLAREGERDYLYLLFDVHRDASRQEIVGHGLLKVDFAAEVNALRSFQHLRPDTLTVTMPESLRLPFDEIADHTLFQAQENAEVRAIERLVLRHLYVMLALAILVLVAAHLGLRILVTRPLQLMASHIDGMRRGERKLIGDPAQTVLPVSELESVRRSLNDYQMELDALHVNLADKNEQLWLLAHRDALTGVYNRRAFDEDCASFRDRGPAARSALLLFDCDHFKPINDTYGHQVGDRVIQGIAESLHGALRSNDRLYRLGGDEFASLLHDVDPEGARAIAERCLDRVVAYDFRSLGVKEPVRISIGICHSRDLVEGSGHELHRNADLAMYHAKRPGQSKIVEYTPELSADGHAILSHRENTAVYQALAEPERIELHYQPIVRLPDGAVQYWEVLARIRDGDALILPGDLFPVVEARRLEVEFDLALIARVEHDLRRGTLPTPQGLSINISGPGIVHDRVLAALLTLAPVARQRKLVVEITETALITQISHAASNLHKLRQAGIQVALDDFGNGYSSLRYLASMPADMVKFDITMVRSLERQDRQATLVADLARMVKDAGFELVAEGVESDTLRQRVIDAGFSHAQGFLFGRPAALTTIRDTATPAAHAKAR